MTRPLPIPTAGVRTCMSRARHIAKRRCAFVATDHLLVALLDKPCPSAARELMAAAGVDLSTVLPALRQALERRYAPNFDP